MYVTMGNTNPVKYATAFTMRTDQEFLDLLDELRVRDERSCDGDALLLAARKLLRQVTRPRPDAYPLERLEDASPPLARRLLNTRRCLPLLRRAGATL